MDKLLEQQFLLFRLGDIKACFSLAETLSVINLPRMIRLPSARGSIIRAFKHQDELGGLVSMRIKFGLPEHGDFTQGRLILGRVHDRLVGFWVDEVLGITSLGDPIEFSDEDLASVVEGGAIDKVVVHRDKRYLHINMIPFMGFEKPEQLTQWLNERDKQWREEQRRRQEEQMAMEREQARMELIQEQQRIEEEIQEKLETTTIDPEITVEYAYGLLDVAEYADAERQAEAGDVVEETAEMAEETVEEAAPEIELPDLGETGGARPAADEEAAPDAQFEEERDKPKKRILWGAARKPGQAESRHFKSIRQLRPGLVNSLKRWRKRLVVLVVLGCALLIFKTIQPGLYGEIVKAMGEAWQSLDLGQTIQALWGKIAAWLQSL